MTMHAAMASHTRHLAAMLPGTARQGASGCKSGTVRMDTGISVTRSGVVRKQCAAGKVVGTREHRMRVYSTKARREAKRQCPAYGWSNTLQDIGRFMSAIVNDVAKKAWRFNPGADFQCPPSWAKNNAPSGGGAYH
eukprot:363721-Chlamydomonas_euryale.AAC.6